MEKMLVILLIIIVLATGCQSDLAHRNEKYDSEILKTSMKETRIDDEKDLLTEKERFKKYKSNLKNQDLSSKKREEALVEIVKILESKVIPLREHLFDDNYVNVYMKQLNQELDRERISQLEDRRARYYFYTLSDGFYRIEKFQDRAIFDLSVDYNKLADYSSGLESDCYEYVKLMGHVQNIQNKMKAKTLNFESIIKFLNTLENYIKTYEDTYYSSKFLNIYKNFAYTLFLNNEYNYFSFREEKLNEKDFIKLTLLKNENQDNWIGEIANQILEFSNLNQKYFYYNVENYLYYYKAFGTDRKGMVENKTDKNSDYIQIKNLTNEKIELKINEDIKKTMEEMIQRYQLIGQDYYQSTALSYVDENYMSVVYRIYLNDVDGFKTYIEAKTYEIETGEVLSLDEILENDLRQYKWILDGKFKARARNGFNEKPEFYGIDRKQTYYLDYYGIVFVFENDDDTIENSIRLYYEELDEIINNLNLRFHM